MELSGQKERLKFGIADTLKNLLSIMMMGLDIEGAASLKSRNGLIEFYGLCGMEKFLISSITLMGIDQTILLTIFEK